MFLDEKFCKKLYKLTIAPWEILWYYMYIRAWTVYSTK